MQFPKSQLFEICLMEAVKNQPVLYDRDFTGYSNKHDIEHAWEQVLAEVNKKVKDVNITHCKLRWRSLRDRYVKQFVKTRNGAIVEPDLSKWAYNEQLNFLRKHLKKRKVGCEKPPSPKKMRVQLEKVTKTEQSSCRRQPAEVIESMTTYNERTHSCSDSSTIYEQDLQVDSLDDYECATETEVAEIEFVPFKPKQNVKKSEQLTENPIPEVSNEVVVDPCSVNETVYHSIDHITNMAGIDEHSMGVAVTTEECINNLMMTVNSLLKEQQKRAAQRNPNEEYFKVLDGLLKKLPAEEVDKVKVDILNFVVNKTKSFQRRSLY